MDDEVQLIELLQEFCRRQRKQVEVFFDNAPPDGVRARNYGLLIARFVRAGTTADTAIHNRLIKLNRAARNWTVVSSDRGVQTSARAAHAQYISSEAFAALLMQVLNEEAQKDIGEEKEVIINPEEVDDWMRLFGADISGADNEET